MSHQTIALLLTDLVGGGAERVNMALAEEFTRRGHSVEFVLLRRKGEFLKEVEATYPIVNLNVARIRDLPFALSKYLSEKSPDVLMASLWPLTVIAPIARRLSRSRCTVMAIEHNTLSHQYRGDGKIRTLLRQLSMMMGYRLADMCVGVSRGVVEDMAKSAKMNVNHFTVIHNPIAPYPAPDPQSLQEASALWNIPKGYRILSVGRFKAQKNHALLLDAFARLDRQDARLMFVGAGENEAEIRHLTKEAGLSERVIFAGFRHNPSAFYHSADLFVLSSDYEGFGNVIVEALATGTPVISTDCPSGPREILADGRFGTLTPTGDRIALAGAIDRALDRILDGSFDSGALIARAQDFRPDKAASRYLNTLGIMS